MAELLSYRGHFNKTLNLAYPVMLSQLGHIMVGVVDSIMVGQLGPTELAASSFANNFMGVFMMFGIGVTYGITPMVAQADGKKDHDKITRLLRHGIILSILVGIVLTLFMYVLTTAFPYMSQPDDVIRLGKPYFFIIATSLFPLIVFQGFRQFAEGMSVTKPTMYITILANGLNVLLNYLLIYGNFG
ncbi:MAG: MATE family efflux transporter, partial [Cytophagia bacterium]|nr:MATE family efflux transporter [Cytophagia bacterium]